MDGSLELRTAIGHHPGLILVVRQDVGAGSYEKRVFVACDRRSARTSLCARCRFEERSERLARIGWSETRERGGKRASRRERRYVESSSSSRGDQYETWRNPRRASTPHLAEQLFEKRAKVPDGGQDTRREMNGPGAIEPYVFRSQRRRCQLDGVRRHASAELTDEGRSVLSAERHRRAQDVGERQAPSGIHTA
jgi:hypothetical protein